METTNLYVELIIIGLETSIWMCMAFVEIIGEKAINFINFILSNFSSSLLLIGVLYIIGILMDGFADMVFKNSEKKIRKSSGLEAQTSLLVWEKYKQWNVSDYMRSKIRILRVSIINIPLIFLSVLCYIVIYNNESKCALICTIILGVFLTLISIKSYFESVKNYYNKARSLELTNEK